MCVEYLLKVVVTNRERSNNTFLLLPFIMNPQSFPCVYNYEYSIKNNVCVCACGELTLIEQIGFIIIDFPRTCSVEDLLPKLVYLFTCSLIGWSFIKKDPSQEINYRDKKGLVVII